MVADKGKRLKVSEKGEEDINSAEHIDGELVLSIEKLQEIQDQLEKINEEASDEVLEVEKKFNEIRKPVYEKRNEIVKSIPDFWVTAFQSHPALCELLNDEDQKIFKHLESLEVEDSKDVKSGYSISFIFKPNPYFENTQLTKTFTFHDEGTTKVTATSIKWKEGMGIPNGVNHEKKGNKRAITDESFFIWFSETQTMDEYQDEIAEIIKEDLWPNPLNYFNNEEADEEDFDEDDEGKDEEEDGSDDDEEDEDEDEGDDDDN